MRGGLLELAGGQLKKIMRTMVYKILRFDFFEREGSYNNKPSYALPVKQQKYLFYPDEGCLWAKIPNNPCSLAKTCVVHLQNFVLPRRKHCEIQNHDLMEDVSSVTLQPI